jgi:hypothetical protein
MVARIGPAKIRLRTMDVVMRLPSVDWLLKQRTPPAIFLPDERGGFLIVAGDG